MKQQKRFPKFANHQSAYCWNCQGDFGPGYWSDAGYAVNCGRYVQYCESCRMATWYDLEPAKKSP